ncbi:phosphatase PAP2 family protein [Streptomyces millisiae]|uniref:Phosphatase PAP2 family protein n=1 Tax=Streptomyces millisiae TaxID=3075542 RepID=A0ABU2LTR7_9ACTN|nr:phosphatase PAP2 family protein [Streptomyces sp. DSM 44918]MDT0320443.1 phosphatase PAP2 family protein [Streptomyces sp. DSM 44918]
MPRQPLTIAAVAAAVLAALMITVAARDGSPFAIDSTLNDWAVDHRSPAWTTTSKVITNTGSGPPAMVLGAIVGALALPRRWWLGAVVGLGTLWVGMFFRWLLVNWLGRPRPPMADWLTHPDNPSMPSGHAATSGMIAIGFALVLSRHAPRAIAYAIPAVWLVLVGISRVYLGVHWPTDIIAGWLYAIAYTALVLPPLANALAKVRGYDTGDRKRES